ncbi:14389_t:CDS:2, partial [Dentiscutata erythropus]
IRDHPELYKVGVDFGDETCNFDDRILQHEEGLIKPPPAPTPKTTKATPTPTPKPLNRST